MQNPSVTEKPDVFIAFQITLYGDSPGMRARVFPQSFIFSGDILSSTSRVAGFDFLPFGGYKDPGEFFEITK